MPRYARLSGDSGVASYESTRESITLTFVDGDRYRYSYLRPGRAAVEHMKALAEAGRGLSTFVSQHVRENYERKLRPIAADAPAAAPIRTGTSPPPPRR